MHALLRRILLDLGALQDCDFAQLTDRLIATMRLYGSARAADLASWPAGSWSTSPAGSSLLDCDGISLRFFDTKQSRIKPWMYKPDFGHPVRCLSLGFRPPGWKR